MDFANQTLLAPLTKGGNLPFRRLCVDFGATVTCSEMIYAHQLIKGNRREQALLRHHPSEVNFGVQLAAAKPQLALEAAQMAVEAGARYVDLNCGCPIHDTVKRGMGARLLQKTRNLESILSLMATNLKVPVTVKLRTGFKDSQLNIDETSKMAEDAGVAAITIHGRSREQRYTRAADWELVGRIGAERRPVVIGNGDILTHYEAEHRKTLSGLSSVMLARGALIKPWLFQELREGRELLPSAGQRIAIYRRLAGYFLDHFGNDEIGHNRSTYFLGWHFSFFSRYRPYPQGEYAQQALEHPLLQTRHDGPPADDPLEQVLTSPDESIHRSLANCLLTSLSDEQAVESIRNLSAETAKVGACSSTTRERSSVTEVRG
ncbi:MAG: tRNA-dihydrouridine synthase family protein [Vulcanimicrobiota bacterium]